MKNARRFQLDELAIRPGTYFNPQTEVMIVVDDSPDWIQISEEVPVDENRRDGLVERFQLAHQPGGALEGDDLGDETDEDEDDEDDDLDGLDEDELDEV
jgi:hypothetical protein